MQGFSSKNNRTRVDCVELLGDMLEEEGLAQCTRNKQKPFAAIAQVIKPIECPPPPHKHTYCFTNMV